MPGELSAVREVGAAFALVAMLGAAGVAGWSVAGVSFARDLLARVLAAAVLVVGQLVGIPLLLGVLGILSLPTVLVVHLGVVGAAVLWARPRLPARATEPRLQPGWGPLDIAGLAAGAAYAVVGLAYSLRRTRSFDFDTKEYHLSNLASWLQEGSIWQLPYAQPGNVTATHPGNGELLGLWLALPTHGDELVYAAPMAFGVLAVLASAVLVRELRGGEPGSAGLGAVAAVAVLSAPLYLVTQVHSLSTDVSASAGLLAAVALLLVARRTGTVAAVALAGMALGLGLGAKYTAFAPAALIALAAIPLLRWSRRWWWLVPGTVAFAVPWFARNLARTGNPLFPQDLEVVDGAQSPYTHLNTTILHHITSGHGAIVREWADLGSDLVGPVALALGAGVIATLVRRRQLPDAGAALLVAAIAVGATVAYLVTPVTGGGPTGVPFIIASCFRYGLVSVLLATALWGGVTPRRVAAGSLAAVIGWNLWRLATFTSPRADVDPGRLVAVGVVAFGLIVLGLWWARSRPAPSGPPVAAALGAGALAALVVVAVVVHRNDRAEQTSPLEALLLTYGDDQPAVVVGMGDLRALLGPRLERPLIGVSRGGEAGEIAFVHDEQMARFVGGAPPPPADPDLVAGLDQAIDATGIDLLVVGYDNPVAHPTGWTPAEGWCLVGGDEEGALYVRAPRLPAGQACETSSA